MLRLSSACIRRTLSGTNGVCQKVVKCRFSHRAHTLINGPVWRGFIHNVNKQSRVYGVCLPRFESTVNTSATANASNVDSALPLSGAEKELNVRDAVSESGFISEIPEAPISPTITEEIIDTIKLHINGEPTFSSIGLGGYGPIGLLEHYFEFIHINFDVPWWAAIVFTSFILKIVSFPLAVDQQRNAHKVQNVGPQLANLQVKVSEARLSGNQEEAMIYAYELQDILKKHNVKLIPVSALLRIGLHLPVFFALRNMIAAPVESMKDGGLYWFKDLTVPDPYYLLPIFATLTLFSITEYTFRSSNSMAHLSQTMQYIIRGSPAISFLFTMHFQGAILCHWVISNAVTMLQNIILQNKKVQKYYNIPPIIQHDTKLLKTTGVMESFKKSWDKMKLTNKLSNYERADVSQFNAAAKAPLQKTYKYNPLKNPPNARAISAMKK